MNYRRIDNLTVVGDHDEATVAQMQNCLRVDGAIGAIMPDGHLGYSQPVGGVAAYPDHVSVSGVGYDIGCGNKLVVTNLMIEDLWPEVETIMDEVFSKISFGMGRNNQDPVEHEVLDEIKSASLPEQRQLHQLATDQLGTVGSGNHYVDLFYNDEGVVCVGVHFGSRGFGHKTASGFLNLARGQKFFSHVKGETMMSDPTLLMADSDLGQAYVEAMQLAGMYAYAGRDVVCDKVLEILGADQVDEVHNHHNFAWRERHNDQDYWVVRKGATPAAPLQLGFVGATMGEPSVVVQGVSSGNVEQELTLYSTVHGAGRVMSRTEAAGKTKTRKHWECQIRGCSFVETKSPESGGPTRCPEHGSPLRKFHKQEVVREGKINFAEVQKDLAERGIVLRGAAADEAPGAYKRLTDVLRDCGQTIGVVDVLYPVGVAMAGRDVRDDYKD